MFSHYQKGKYITKGIFSYKKLINSVTKGLKTTVSLKENKL